MLAARRLPGTIEAATVDHGLRPDSAKEAAFVARESKRLDVPHETLEAPVSDGNLQSKARDARYAALSVWAERRGLAAIVTAHHADDQAETLLLRLNRGSGLAGLAGTRARTSIAGVRVLRPLLGWRKHELNAIVVAANIAPVDDPSNRDPRFDRSRVRSALRNADWLDVAAWSASARHLADAERAIAWMAEREYVSQVEEIDGVWRYTPAAPRAIRLRIVARIVEQLGQTRPRGGEIASLIDRLDMGGAGTLGGVIARGGASWWLEREEGTRRN